MKNNKIVMTTIITRTVTYITDKYLINFQKHRSIRQTRILGEICLSK
jgi:hypothetical protein